MILPMRVRGDQVEGLTAKRVFLRLWCRKPKKSSSRKLPSRWSSKWDLIRWQ
jgi:hypothetical protein